MHSPIPPTPKNQAPRTPRERRPAPRPLISQNRTAHLASLIDRAQMPPCRTRATIQIATTRSAAPPHRQSTHNRPIPSTEMLRLLHQAPQVKVPPRPNPPADNGRTRCPTSLSASPTAGLATGHHRIPPKLNSASPGCDIVSKASTIHRYIALPAFPEAPSPIHPQRRFSPRRPPGDLHE